MNDLSAPPLPMVPLQQVDAAPGASARPAAAGAEGARRAAEEFEAVFVAQMLAPIFATIESDGPFGGGPAEETYRTMLVDEYGKAIARAGGFGIADAVEREILRLQEVPS